MFQEKIKLKSDTWHKGKDREKLAPIILTTQDGSKIFLTTSGAIALSKQLINASISYLNKISTSYLNKTIVN